MKVLLAIPARYGSTRFEGKPLADICGKTMIQRIVEQCKLVQDLTQDHIDVVVATDDLRIFNHVSIFGKAIMTSSTHQSGTDRIAEVATHMQNAYDVIINVQGDEPLIHPKQILQLIDCFRNTETQIATLIKPESFTSELTSSNAVKCVVDIHLKALYFSRFPIPYYRDEATRAGEVFYRHVGMYGFNAPVLEKLTQLPTSMLEKAESLEQLRWLENGFQIQTALTNYENISVDSPEDLDRVVTLLTSNQH